LATQPLSFIKNVQKPDLR